MAAKDTRTCQGPACDRDRYARGWCEMHYRRWLRTGEVERAGHPTTCSVDGCERDAKSRGWCHAHYLRWYRDGELTDHVPLRVSAEERSCRVAGCGRPIQARDLCGSHYQRWRQRGAVDEEVAIGRLPQPPRARTSSGWVSGGYRYVPVDESEQHLTDGAPYAAEHRLVMARHLGRPLRRDENVHHRNGDRRDNRLPNLELWSVSQPSGQRIEDKVRFAVDILQRYSPELLRTTSRN